jgi:hypothetical protein
VARIRKTGKDAVLAALGKVSGRGESNPPALAEAVT